MHPSQTDSDYQTLMVHNIKIASDYADTILRMSNEDVTGVVVSYERERACGLVSNLADVFERVGDAVWKGAEIACAIRGLSDKIRVGE